MRPKTAFLPLLGSAIVVCLSSASAQDLTKLQNNLALNTAASWQQGIAPGSSNVLTWSAPFEVGVPATNDLAGVLGTLPPLGGDVSVAGFRIGDVAGARNVQWRTVGFHNPSSPNTLTLGSAGIDMSAAFHSLFINSRVSVGADQTWNISDANNQGNPLGFNNGEDLAFRAEVLNSPFDFGGSR